MAITIVRVRYQNEKTAANGDAVRPVEDVRVHTQPGSLADAAHDEPENGVYLVARTWNGTHVLELDAHFDRLERSAAAFGHTLRVPRDLIRALIAENLPLQDGVALDARFRVTAVLEEEPCYIISIEEAVPVSPEILQDGADCVVRYGAARQDAEVKTTAWMHRRRELSGYAGGGRVPYEYLLADDVGQILEGATSNFYAVLDGELRTAEAGVLRGITRRIVLEVAPAIIPVRLVPVRGANLDRVEEAFITSATRGVVPTRRIDTVELGAPGPVTRQISRAYETWLQSHLEPLVPATS